MILNLVILKQNIIYALAQTKIPYVLGTQIQTRKIYEFCHLTELICKYKIVLIFFYSQNSCISLSV